MTPLSFLAATLLASAPIQGTTVPREHQPDVLNPGLDGGSQSGFNRGDVSPDGRLMVAYRNFYDCRTGRLRRALTVSVLREDGFLFDGITEKLEAFDNQGQFVYGNAPTSIFQASQFCPNPEDGTDLARVNWAFDATEDDTLYDPILNPPPEGYLLVDDCDGGEQGYIFEPGTPLYPPGVGAWVAVAIKQDSIELPQGNPYPSDAFGQYQPGGGHTTYRLWLVITHAQAMAADGMYQCNPDPIAGDIFVGNVTPNGADIVLACQDLEVVIREPDATQTYPEIVSTSITDFELIESDATPEVASGLPGPTPGIELSVTADGRMIFYHGRGNTKQNQVGNGAVTYIYNHTGYSSTGWTQPRSITELPDETNDLLASGTDVTSHAQFEQRYRLFQFHDEFKLPALPGQTAPFTYAVGDLVRGPYPWISKDGSFFLARSVESTHAVGSPVVRIRSGGYVLGDITGGYIKHVDDVGVNPTRRGGPWFWPTYTNLANPLPNSWSTLGFTTGLKPGIWEPLLGSGAPFPIQQATRRVPVMPFITPNNDTYGEVRFPEADGNYMHFFECNEAMEHEGQSQPFSSVAPPLTYRPDATPDTSGRDERAIAVLDAGAAFPHELLVNSGEQSTEDAAVVIRAEVGAALGHKDSSGVDQPFHENLGFKGQAITFSGEGSVRLEEGSGFSNASGFTLQAFVKRLSDPSNLVPLPGTPAPADTIPLIEHAIELPTGAVVPVIRLSLRTDGSVVSSVVNLDTGLFEHIASDPGVVPPNQDWYDREAGWVHLAMTMDVVTDEAEASSTVHSLFVDGHLVPGGTLTGPSSQDAFDTPGPGLWFFGPGRGSDPDPVDASNRALMLDEIAVSDVARTVEELRRDAYVAQDPSKFGPWPLGSIPAGLDPEDAFWPTDPAAPGTPLITDWSQEKENLGSQLFSSTLLSKSGSVSCSSCHKLNGDLADPGQQFSVGQHGALTVFNTPSILNAAFGSVKTFEGKAQSLEDQVVFPLENPDEMGPQEVADVVNRLNAIPAAKDAFNSAFETPAGPGATEENLAAALGIFMRTRLSGGSEFDNGLGALSMADKGRGLFFGKARCFACHRGSAFQDNSFHNIGTITDTANISGLGETNGRSGDMWALKTPGLRNVENTGPFFHDGSRGTLHQVVEHYNDPFAGEIDPDVEATLDRNLRPLGLEQGEVDALVAFLVSLTGS